jgi:FkbM family methyltransferase
MLKNKIQAFKEILYFDNFIEILFNYLFLHKRNFVRYCKNNTESILQKNKNDVNGFRATIANSEYLKSIEYIKKIGFKDLSVLDLGFNLGAFPILLIIHKFKIKEYYGYEFNPFTYVRGGINIESNLNCPQTLNCAAVSNQEGHFKYRVLRKGSTGESIYSINSDLEIEIKSISLNGIFNVISKSLPIDIVKIDIEGAEYEIFFGDKFQKLKNAKFLLMEIHNNVDISKDDLIKVVEGLNFQTKIKTTLKNTIIYLFQNIELV